MSDRKVLGERDPVDVAQTVLRVVGKDGKMPVLDVAAFNSFVDDSRPVSRAVITLMPDFSAE